MPETVLISGINGFVGRTLQKQLLASGFKVKGLTHNKSKTGPDTFFWNTKEGYIDDAAIKNVNYIVHLAGSGVADKRWTNTRKQEIISSRVNSTLLLAEALERNNHKIKALVGASAVGYYGAITSEKIYKETDPEGSDFLSECCVAWEKSYDALRSFTERSVIIRISNVIGKGGMIKKLKPLAEKGVLSPLGSGKQYTPWISVDDLSGLIQFAITNQSLSGVYNAVAPEHITNEQLTKQLCTLLNKKVILPKVPAFAIKLLYGEMAVVILNGSRISNNKITEAGFKFEHPRLEDALKKLK
jgi:uncharacterized protein (TIGR01777 family)